jgi:hypothetical protein
MPIEDRKMVAGTVLVARYKKQDRTCEVVETAEGFRYRLDDGSEHKSPSSAGKAAMAGVACNGWRFWSIQGTEAPKREPKAKTVKEPKPNAPGKKRSHGRARITPKAKAPKAAAARSRKSDASYGCGVCPETFPTQKKAVAHAMTHTA